MEADELENEVARQVVAQLAPAELELFPLISEAYRRDPDRVSAGGSGRDEMLGFGLETGAVLMTPVVLAAVTEVVRYLTGEVAEALGVKGWLRRRLRPRSRGPVELAALDAAQLARVRAIVAAKCEQAGLAAEQSQLLADSVLGALSSGS